MAAVPIVINCLVYPRNKTVAPYPATICGWSYNPTVGIGGGPIIPPDQPPPEIDNKPPEPPLTIWPKPGDPDYPIFIPPDQPPVDPPTTPTPPHEGWNWSAAKSGWYYLYVPGPGQAGPKKK